MYVSFKYVLNNLTLSTVMIKSIFVALAYKECVLCLELYLQVTWLFPSNLSYKYIAIGKIWSHIFVEALSFSWHPLHISVVFLLSFPLASQSVPSVSRPPTPSFLLARVMCALWWLACVHQLMRLQAQARPHICALPTATTTFQFVVYCISRNKRRKPAPNVPVHIKSRQFPCQDRCISSGYATVAPFSWQLRERMSSYRIDVCVH